ncbi:MAG: glycerol-3-phosphate 1-O-acyltransferase PlsY [Planctomycetota bacterium]|jgi:glycerol-3-phosphate acyltransferase PlsY
MITWLPCILGAYLLGSIPFGYLIARGRGIDIRAKGSGNVGATNVGRVLGRRFGILCFFLDAGKGAVSVIGSGLLTGAWARPVATPPDQVPLAAADVWLWLAVAAGALLGHMYSPWLGFRGGKGVATGFGGLLSMWSLMTIPAAVALVLWGLTLRLTRYVSMASMIAALSLPVTTVLMALATMRRDDLQPHPLRGALPLMITTVALAALVVFQHRGNLARLRAGTEPKVGRRSNADGGSTNTP